MLQLFLFVAALLITALVETTARVPAWCALAGAGALVLGSHLASGLVARRSAAWRMGFWLVLLAGHAALVFLAGWPGAVWARLEPGRLPLLDRVAAILPFVLACLAAWRRFGLRNQLRQSAIPALPLLAFQGLWDLIESREAFRTLLGVYPVLQTLLVVAIVLAAVLAAPWMVRAMWPTRPLPEGPLRCLLESLAAVADVRLRGIYVWDMGLNRPANACVTGVAGFHRSVLLSEGLVERLDTEEVASVFAHEIAHARLHHFVVFLLYALGFLLLLDPLDAAMPARWADWGLAAAGVLWFLGFGLLSRRLEREADCFGASLVGSVPLFVRTLRKVGSRPGAPQRWSFRHFPLETRIDQLYRIATMPGEGRRLRRIGGAMRLAVVAVFIAGLVFTSLAVVRDLRAASGRGGPAESAQDKAGK